MEPSTAVNKVRALKRVIKGPNADLSHLIRGGEQMLKEARRAKWERKCFKVLIIQKGKIKTEKIICELM